MRRSAPALGVALLAATNLASPASAQSVFDRRSDDFTFAGVTFPAVVDTFAVLSVSRWPQVSMGVAIHYASPIASRSNFDVYVYPVPDSLLQRTSEVDRLEAEFAEALAGISEYREGRDGVTVELDYEEPSGMAWDGVQYHGLMGMTTLTRGTEVRRSLAYVFEKDGHFIKYRISFAREQWDGLEPRIEEFVAETLGRIRVAAPVPGG